MPIASRSVQKTVLTCLATLLLLLAKLASADDEEGSKPNTGSTRARRENKALEASEENDSKPTAKKAKVEAARKGPVALKQNLELRTCAADFVTAMGGLANYGTNESYYAVLVNLSDEKDSKATTKILRYGFYLLSLRDLKLSYVMGIDTVRLHAMLLVGTPFDGFIAVSFDQAAAPCFQGEARYWVYSLAKRTNTNTSIPMMRGNGFLSTARGHPHDILYDYRTHSVLEFDLVAMQLRKHFIPLSEGESILYLNSLTRQRYDWQREIAGNTARGVIAYQSERSPLGGLAMQANDKLIQQDELFGALQQSNNARSIKLVELSDWSSKPAERSYTLALPEAFKAGKPRLEVNLKKQLIAIAANDEAPAKDRKHIDVFNYATQKKLHELSAPAGQYFDGFSFAPSARYLIGELRSLANKKSYGLSVYNLATGKTNILPFKNAK